MFHIEKNKPGLTNLCVAPADSPDTIRSLTAFLNLVGSCSGPNGGFHMVRNTCGGHLTMTSDSGRLLASLTLSRQVLKLLVSSVQAHLRIYGDGGKYLTFACLSLIISTVQLSGEFANYRAFCALNEHFVKIVSNYLNSEDCAVCVNADLSDIQVLLAYTRSVISSRSWLNLVEDDCNKITQLIVKCFVESIPGQGQHFTSQYSDGIFIVDSPFKHSRETRLLEGLLLEHTELSCVKGEVALNLKTVSAGKSEENTGVDTWRRQIKVAVVTCSMSGDLEDIISATYEVTSAQAVSVENLALDKWADFCDKLALCQVGLVLCQKVIHPRLKILLKSLKVMAIDRLGSAVIPYIKDLTGAEPVVSVIADTDPENLVGYISGAQHLILNNKSYVHLTQPSASVVSLILCSRTEESLEEFKCCVKTAIRGLYSLLQEGKLLAGAGCWQIHCSYKLDEEVRKCLPSLAETVGCSEVQVLSALNLFRSSVFHHWVQQLHRGQRYPQDCWDLLAVDAVSKHCWLIPNVPSGAWSGKNQLSCCCGLKTSEIAQTASDDFLEPHPPPILNPIHNAYAHLPFIRKNTGHKSQSCDQTQSLSASTRDDLECLSSTKACSDIAVNINSTLDHFSAATQGLFKAVFTANLVLSIGHVISDSS
ncbi:McKusick-Kaufman/Bardet-Biedl syndromes putative chaperonin [Elysia marginata]|uniref:McKusick-Kaufman/Bardet-Biedl syndromes putative chaperonin n=1 Tax=Elysia marginata TaxID=1093978 RepID=A0AAV4IKW7_9GAST|nr:McKusick-Kaufman/Bardet-Biedl syndromes putative chaperonin [Elysia marginata]